MLIRRIVLKNFKCFIEKDEYFEHSVLIRGSNGSGKSTLALQSILFALYGYSLSETLKDLPTRNIAKSCSVEIEFKHNNKYYRILRLYPSKLTIFENNKQLQFTTLTEAQDFINLTFGDRLNFMKFRIVDAYSKDTNFLDEGPTTLKQIIFSASEDTFNNIRKKLLQIKTEREIYSKNRAIIYTHYPSTKRLQLICSKLEELEKQDRELRKTIRDIEIGLNTAQREIGRLEGEKQTLKYKRDKMLSNTKCYACGQAISESHQKSLLSEIGARTKKINNRIGHQTTEIEFLNDIIGQHKRVKDNIEVEMVVLRDLKLKLQTRMKQSDYKYTEKDILIVKRAIQEIDRLSTYYLTESVKILEPIINDVLAKINFQVRFEIDDKNKFRITLQKDEVEYKYKDLSTGQKLILQIAFKLAILLERGETGLIVADEGMSSLDRENLEHILGLFHNLPFQLFLVIHRLDDIPSFIKVIDLDKEEINDNKKSNKM